MQGLERFVDAQEPVIKDVLEELRNGSKVSHWMWFIFPQIQGLGHSSMAQFYAISGLKEAQEYLQHPVLSPRLLECTRLLLGIQGRSVTQIMGTPDDLKLRSSMTLFAQAAPEEKVFQQVLDKYFGGKPDERTLQRL